MTLSTTIRLCSALAAAAVLTIAAACSSTSLSGPSDSVTKCQVTLTVPPAALAAAGGNGSLSVSAAPECAWAASTQTPWISDLSPANGQGAGTLQFKVAGNSTPATRQGEIVVNSVSARVSQEAAPCSFDVNPKSVNVPADGGSASATVAAAGGCTWTAVSQASWLTVTGGATGDGNGTVAFTAAANPDALTGRTGTILAAGQAITVTQPARGCQIGLNPTQQAVAVSGGSGTVAVTAGAGCSWTAMPDSPWITITSGGSGSGNGSFGFTVAANSGTARSGQIAVGGAIFTITQGLSCVFTLTAAGNPSFPSAGGSGSVNVGANAGCAWTAASNDSWITITSGASGSGPGAVAYTVAQNTNTSGQRSGSMTIAGQSFAVNQGPAPCVFTLSPSSQNIGSGAGTGTVDVHTTAGCAWNASTSDPWLQLTTASGNGPGTIAFSAIANTGGQRTGTISAMGQSASIVQAAIPCGFLVSPMTQQVNMLGTNRIQLTLTTTLPSCTWTAASADPSWVHVATASGTGSGTIDFTVDGNISFTPRNNSISISGSAPTVTASIGQDALVCSFSLNPQNQTVSSAAGTGSPITITANVQLCAWTASTNDSWIHLTAPTTGTGNGTLGWTYDANTGPQQSGAIAISGQTFSVTQTNGCTYSTPTPPLSGVPGNTVTTGSFAVTTGAGCTWTATSNDPWLTITNGTGVGSGPGTVTFEVAGNPTGAIRNGSFSLQGQPIFTVIQDP